MGVMACSSSDGFQPGRYDAWQTIQVAPSTGAVCGDGSPFKFFVNRVADTRNTIVYMEGGGACWDYASCTGQTGVRGARNPNGIPDDYMSLLNPGASLLEKPFSRERLLARVRSILDARPGDARLDDARLDDARLELP